MNLGSAWSEAVEFRPVPLSSDSSGLRQIFYGYSQSPRLCSKSAGQHRYMAAHCRHKHGGAGKRALLAGPLRERCKLQERTMRPVKLHLQSLARALLAPAGCIGPPPSCGRGGGSVRSTASVLPAGSRLRGEAQVNVRRSARAARVANSTGSVSTRPTLK